ncbi:MAG TPA: hypothetical protein PLI39_01405 [Petrotogaceae bacterium]|nr:hypothetical protein [Petrotogaceae bacterium]HQO11728.1 hypothetical protein [Petrotogaceae bacterium]
MIPVAWWSPAKKDSNRDIAVKRMNDLVTNRREACATAIKFENKSEEEIESIVTYIKDYACRNLSVNEKDVKVHISKDGNIVTIIASISYK